MRKCLSILMGLLILLTFVLPVAANEGKEELIIINKKNNRLAYYVDGEKIKEFDVATGKTPSLTPEGTFKIVNKIKNRPYYKENIPGGDPRNPLGDRWLGLEVNGTKGTTYAIHGNNNKNSIGKYVSAGCIRMHNDEVRWLFDQVSLNTPVIITSSKLAFDEIAKNNGFELGYQPLVGGITLNDLPLQLDVQPVLYKGRAMVPLRSYFEAMGATVEWKQETQTVTITYETQSITHQVRTNQAMVNGVSVKLDVESKIIKGSTMLPLRFFTEALGASAEWEASSQSIKLFVPQKEMVLAQSKPTLSRFSVSIKSITFPLPL